MRKVAILTGIVAAGVILTGCSASVEPTSNEKIGNIKINKSEKELPELEMKALTQWTKSSSGEYLVKHRIVQVGGGECVLQTLSSAGGLATIPISCDLAKPQG